MILMFVLENADAWHVHPLSSLMHCVLILGRGGDPVELGLTKPEDRELAYIQYLDPGDGYVHDGSVIFGDRRVMREKV